MIPDVTKLYTIDVIIPVYNGENYLKRSVGSVLAQTYLPDRIIIVDDGSTDNTEQMVRESISNNNDKPKIEYYKIAHRGLSATRNFGLSKCSADFIAFIDVDDEWLPSKLERQLSVFKTSRYINLGVVYCSFFVSSHSQLTLRAPTNKDFIQGDIFDKLLSTQYGLKSPSLCLLRSSVIRDIGMFDECLYSTNDLDYWLRVAQKYQFDYVNEPLARIWDEPFSLSKPSLRILKDHLVFYNKWSKLFVSDTEALTGITSEIARLIFKVFHLPKVPQHRKSVIGKIQQILQKPSTFRLMARFFK